MRGLAPRTSSHIFGELKMKTKRLITICALVLTLLPISAYASSPVDANFLGAATSFGVLGGSNVTNIGDTVIYGDLGVYPGSSITGFPPGSYTGALHNSDAVALEARSDTTAAYTILANMMPTLNLSGTDLGGLTLTPGVYKVDVAAGLTGELTLDVEDNPDAFFVFQIGSTLTTGSGSSVVMINAPENFCNKYWQIGTSATLGSDTDFMGNILAYADITLNGGTLDGRALARTGKVEITDTETITAQCVIPEPATICLLGLGSLALIRRKRRA